ncbi:hypothetical protein SVIOM342S_08969 [Streptomyces violaceorubidus]
MNRAVAYLAARGVDQFLDIGTGIPTEPNLHQIVQRTVPTARVVYADNDPIVLRHAQALLAGSPEGATDYIQADVREPEDIVRHARGILDFDRPIALSLIALTHYLGDQRRPRRPRPAQADTASAPGQPPGPVPRHDRPLPRGWGGRSCSPASGTPSHPPHPDRGRPLLRRHGTAAARPRPGHQWRPGPGRPPRRRHEPVYAGVARIP